MAVDSAHGHSKSVLNSISNLRIHFDKLYIFGGNVTIGEGECALVEARVDVLKVGIGYIGCKNIKQLNTKPRFVRIKNAGLKDSHFHEVPITKEAQNYPALNPEN